MTPQEIFNTVATHLFTQGERAMLDKTLSNSTIPSGFPLGCAYRNSKGLKCAAGCLISDENYDPEMEGQSARELTLRFNIPDWFKSNIDLIENLQNAHDFPEHWTTTGLMKVALADVANYNNLSTDILQNLKFKDR